MRYSIFSRWDMSVNGVEERFIRPIERKSGAHLEIGILVYSDLHLLWKDTLSKGKA